MDDQVNSAMKHSTAGIQSCIAFALVVCCCLYIAFAFAAPRPPLDPNNHAGEWQGLHTGADRMFKCLVAAAVGLLSSFVGFVMGLLGLRDRQQKRTTAVAGAILNGLVLVSFAVWFAFQIIPMGELAKRLH